MYRPEVGEECYCMWDSDDKSYGIVLPIGYSSDGVLVYEWIKTPNATRVGEIDFADGFALKVVIDGHPNFKPIKSEREETIERIAESLRQTFVGSCYTEANRLYDAGLRFKEDDQDV